MYTQYVCLEAYSLRICIRSILRLLGVAEQTTLRSNYSRQIKIKRSWNSSCAKWPPFSAWWKRATDKELGVLGGLSMDDGGELYGTFSA